MGILVSKPKKDDDDHHHHHPPRKVEHFTPLNSNKTCQITVGILAVLCFIILIGAMVLWYRHRQCASNQSM